MVFTVAAVPTGIKQGVSTVLLLTIKVPDLDLPEVFLILKSIIIILRLSLHS